MKTLPTEDSRKVLDALEFRRAVEIERERSRQSRIPFSLLVATVHEEAAPRVAQILRGNLRTIDAVGWIGRSRVALLLPYTTDEEARSLQDALTRDLEPAGGEISWGGSVLRLPVAARLSSAARDGPLPRIPAARLVDAEAGGLPRRRVVVLLLVALALLFIPPICCCGISP